ncbi:MAG: hypothetical protein IJK10_05640 [Firmicutes bacterium]|nr:hypothetical protein [Bacillota bacterium]
MAGGLGLAPDGVPLSEEQKKNIANTEASGVAAVAAEQKADRKKALEAKSGLEVLDEHKAAIGGLPKKFKDPHAEIEEATASQQLRGLCLDILATRRSIAAQRMVLLQKKAAFQQDKNSDKLGTKGLMAQAQGDGAKLVESYALAKQDKLEYYNPVAPAPAKNGPQNEAENKEYQKTRLR